MAHLLLFGTKTTFPKKKKTEKGGACWLEEKGEQQRGEIFINFPPFFPITQFAASSVRNKHSVHWGNNPHQKTLPALFCQAPS